MANFTAVFDAYVLYPAPLRDLLMSVALTDQFRARWTEEIHCEWIYSLLQDRPDLEMAQLQRTAELMNQAVPDCLVDNYGDLIDFLHLPDPNDRHVLAAAIKCQANVIVTNNIKDFPEVVVGRYDIDVQSSDVFLSHLLN